MTSRMVVFPAPDGPNRASLSPARYGQGGGQAELAAVKLDVGLEHARSRCRRPAAGQGDYQQDQGERQRRGQPRLLQRRPDLQRYPVRVIRDDHHGAERAHGPGPGHGQRHGQAGRGERQRDPARHPGRPVAQQRGLFLDGGIDRGERGLRAQHVVRGRLVHLRDDQGQEGVGRGQVDVAEQLTDGRVRADHENQQQADDQRRQQQAAQHARLPDPGERQRAAGQLPGQRGAQDQQHGQRDHARLDGRDQRVERARDGQRGADLGPGQVGQQRDHRAEQGDPDDRGAGPARRPRWPSARSGAGPTRRTWAGGLAAQLTRHG